MKIDDSDVVAGNGLLDRRLFLRGGLTAGALGALGIIIALT